jgi:DnaJ-class molecular chaperone
MSSYHEYVVFERTKCPSCGGTGKILTDRCPDCKGSGRCLQQISLHTALLDVLPNLADYLKAITSGDQEAHHPVTSDHPSGDGAS